MLGDLLLSFGVLPLGTTTFLIGALMSIIGFIAISMFFEETYVPKLDGKSFHILKDFANIKIAFCKPGLNNYLISLLFSMLAFGLFFSDIPVLISRKFMDHSAFTGTILSTEAIIFSLTVMFGGRFVFNYCSKLE